jgi:PTH2 family peptidyl-tRNA hydrolase
LPLTPVLLCGTLIAASLGIGYRLGQKSTTLLPASSENIVTEVQEAEDSEDEDEEIADGDLSAIKAGFMEPCKLVGSSTMQWM